MKRRFLFIVKDTHGEVYDIWDEECIIRKDGSSKQITEFICFGLHLAGPGGKVEVEDVD